ncbi:MAG: hypothetical protein JW902_17710 [Syntrophaceae bacterium]|nr:hypothetical protein [Syntrophaceae bacterium]
MEFRESAKRDLEETISEIASILGEGYLRYRRGRRLPTSSSEMAGNVVQPKESEAFTENRLDCSADRSLHSCSG